MASLPKSYTFKGFPDGMKDIEVTLTVPKLMRLRYKIGVAIMKFGIRVSGMTPKVIEEVGK